MRLLKIALLATFGAIILAANAQQRGRSFEQALALAVQTILVSPDFLFRIEKGP